MKRYFVNDLYLTIQGEGVRAGTPNVFLRFSKCNLQCNVAEHGFDCDTEFESGEWMSLQTVVEKIRAIAGACRWVVFTGGEPALQLDELLLEALRAQGFSFAIETNGTRLVPRMVDWVCVSPKPGAELRQFLADEVKYVCRAGQEPDVDPRLTANHWLISPAFKGDEPDPDAIAWCVQWVKGHPRWRLSLQTHKFLHIP